MGLLHNIGTVARYEAKTLRRSWFFRLFSLGALVIFSFMNIGIFSPIGDEDWDLVSIPSSVPLINLYLLNIGQAIVVIFLAADFLKRDKKVDTNEVLYTRSMSNMEYVLGKTWGILRLFLGLNIIILSIAFVINLISKSMTIDFMSYIYYLLIISVPTILFSLGLAFMLMSVIRNQAVTFLVLLGIAAMNMFWLWFRWGSIFDYMAFGLPVFKSQLVGFDNLELIVNQRLLYAFLGITLVLATILLFKRLPQSKLHSSLSFIFMLVFLAGSIICAINTVGIYRREVDEKKLVIDTNRQFEETLFPNIMKMSVDFEHTGTTLKASAACTFTNDNLQPVERYVFSLNPYLEVTEVEHHGARVDFKKTNHLLEVEPPQPLLPGGTDSLTISYSGSIDESFCFPDYSSDFKDNPYRIAMVNVNKRQAFLTEKFVLLTPESHWYPVSGLNYYPSNPARIKVDFTRFTLRVKEEKGLNAVSQGSMRKENGFSVFSNESPLTGLTLAIGDYASDTLKVDSVKYIAYFFPGHDYYRNDLKELRDTLPLLVSGIMRELETNFSTKYPFSTLSLVEVPVQFYSYPRMSTQTRAELQPSMVLLPEKLSTLENAGFRKQFTRQKKRMARNNQVITDKELQVRLFNNFIRNTFISGENFRFINGVVLNEPTRYRLGPSFYFFKNNFYSAEFPVINSVFEAHLQKVVAPDQGFRPFGGGLSENDKANLILREGSFREILSKNPGSDTVRAIVSVKGDYLFNLMRTQAGIEEFKKWFSQYLDDKKFRRVDILSLNNDMKEKFGIGFYPYLDDWFNKKEQPGFRFTDIQATEIVVDDRVRYLVSFTASNPEPVAGIFNISFRSGGPGGGRGGQITSVFQGGPGGGRMSISMQGRGMEVDDLSRIVFIGPGEARRLKIILDAQPRAMLVNTLFAKNIPGEINIPIPEVIKSKSKTTISETDEILNTTPAFSEPGELIVDNEDPGFNSGTKDVQSPLKKILGVEKRRGDLYQEISMYYVPDYWQLAVQSAYFGKYVLSSVFTRGGTGDKAVEWKTAITSPGYYDIYCWVGKTADRMVIRMGQGGGAPPPPPPGGGGDFRGESPYKDMHYKIYHDEGIDEITVDFENAEAGWNNLGRYYLSRDSARVALTNQSAGRVVLGDAIKWVKVN